MTSPTPAYVTELAKQHAEAAVAALVEALAYPGERVPAAVALLTAAFGQPTLPIAIDSNGLVVEFRDGQPPALTNGEDVAERRHAGRPVV